MVVRQFMSQLGKREILKGNAFWLTVVKAIAWVTQGELKDIPVNLKRKENSRLTQPREII